ncbi:MAG: GNAT family N-acetyltransferase [Pseudomonadales bacterium]
MAIEIRPASEQDKERCLELLDDLRRAAGGTLDAQAGEAFDRLLAAERGEVLVAADGGSVLGLASVSYNLAMRYGGEYCQLEELIVDPSARGRNVGALLVTATVERARSRGCAEYGLYLVQSTEKNLPFYEKFGFERVGSELRQRLQ